MNLIKFNPFHTLNEISRFDDHFNRSIADFVGSDFVATTPSVNVHEDDRSFAIEVAAPGLNRADFNLSVEKNSLIVSAEKSSDTKEEKSGRYRKREFSFASFKRSVYLPKSVDRDAISATYENGVLTVQLPKKEEVVKAEQVRTIEIG